MPDLPSAPFEICARPATETVSPATVQLALAVNPGQTAHQLASRLGLRVTWADQMTQAHDVRQCKGCGLWLIWEPKEAAENSPAAMAVPASNRSADG